MGIFSRSATIILFIIAPMLAPAQKDLRKYKEEADIMRAEVWGWEKPEFNVRDIPAEYAGTSKVIIARYEEYNADGRAKSKDSKKGFAVYRKYYSTQIVREAIKLNDKPAVDEYSQLSYTQIIKGPRQLFAQPTITTYIGVRVIKPDGAIKEIDANEMIVAEENKTKTEVKLAITDLAVGDIIDYFLARQEDLQSKLERTIFYNIFTLFDDAPIMSYSIHIEVPKKYDMKYLCYNKAPDFAKIDNMEGDRVYDLAVKNIPANTESGLWTSPYRQFQLIKLHILRPSSSFGLGATGTPPLTPASLTGEIRDYFTDLVKNRKLIDPDSLSAGLYYLFRYKKYLDVELNDRIDDMVASGNRKINRDADLATLKYWLSSRDVSAEFVSVASRSGSRFNEILYEGELDVLLKTRGSEKRMMGISDIFSPAFHIPYEYENSDHASPQADIDMLSKWAGIIIPASSSSDNRRIERIEVIPSTNGIDMQVNRRTMLKGHYRSEAQKKLILFEDYCNSERKLLGASTTIIEELTEKKNKKGYELELKAAFDKARSKQKDDFADEARDWLGQPVNDVTEHKIENMGVRHQNPDFIYSSKFTIGGLIKKAGNNLIVDIGKLQGTPLNITPAQRKRKVDIYMPFARSFEALINLKIPEGYTAEGVNELNKKVENETGYFMTEATSDGKTVTIKVSKSYNHAFEPVGNWEKLLAFIDAANEWSNAKILLKKK